MESFYQTLKRELINDAQFKDTEIQNIYNFHLGTNILEILKKIRFFS